MKLNLAEETQQQRDGEREEELADNGHVAELEERLDQTELKLGEERELTVHLARCQDDRSLVAA